MDSVLAQTYKNIELIVVDDGSTDKTAQVLKEYGEKIRYIYQKNQGVSSARNRGIEAANGEWIAFLDSDDLWVPDKLATQIDDIQRSPEVAASIMDCLVRYGHKEEISLFRMRKAYEDFKKSPLRKKPLIDVLMSRYMTPTWMVRRSILNISGVFNPKLRIYEDIDLMSRVALEGAFYANCKIGAIIRWRPNGTEALSQKYQTNRVECLKDLIFVYNKLIKSNRLRKEEEGYLARQLSGLHFNLAEHLWKKGLSGEGYHQLWQSIIINCGIRSTLRATLAMFGIWEPVNKIVKNKGNSDFNIRRSELI